MNEPASLRPDRTQRATVVKSRASIDTPIIIVVGFNLFTLAVFITAPVWWDSQNLNTLYLLVLCCQLLILIGFQLGRNRGLSTRSGRGLFLSSGDRAMPYLLRIYACTFLISYAFRMGFSPLDVGGMADLLATGIRDRHFGYQMALRGTGLGPIPWSVYFATSIFNQCFFIAGFLQWSRMNRITGAIFAIFVCLDLFFSMGRGTSFGIVSMVTTFFMASLLWMRSTSGKILLTAVLFAGSVAFFSYNLYSRSGNVERRIELTEFGKSTIVPDHPAFSIVPEALQPTYLNVVSYFGGGYYHTSLALDLDFRSTWPFGSNPALIDLASSFGLADWNDTYMHRLQVAKDVDEFGVWHSAYTWFASDVSFYGVPVLLFGLAYVFGFSWARSLQGDFLSRIVFVILGNMLLFLFANNTYLSSVFYSFMFVLPLWIATRVFGLSQSAVLTPGGEGVTAAFGEEQMNPEAEA